MKDIVKFCCLFLFLSDAFCNVIVIEGMPGSGKTSAILHLAYEFEGRCIVLSEMNPEPYSSWKDASAKEQNAIFHEKWVERMQIIKRFSKNHSFLLDRNYLSNLAFAYALDEFQETNFYPLRKGTTAQDLDVRSDYSLLIILDTSPERSLERRKQSGEFISWPWTEIAFLKAFQKFYREELRELIGDHFIYIQTDDLSEGEVCALLREKIAPLLKDQNESPSPISKEEIEKLLQFAEINQLGSRHSLPIRVFSFPTIYFPKHSIQLDSDGNPLFFNNARLENVFTHSESLIESRARK